MPPLARATRTMHMTSTRRVSVLLLRLLLAVAEAATVTTTAGAPALPLPPHCWMLPVSQTSARINTLNRSGHLVCLPESPPPASPAPNSGGGEQGGSKSDHSDSGGGVPGHLVLFLPGTRLRPENYTLFAGVASGAGRFVLALDWVNYGCRPPQMAPPACMNGSLYVADRDCTTRCYATPLFGDYTRGNTTANPLGLAAADGVFARAAAALRYLAVADARWAQFLLAGRGCQDCQGGVDWSRVTLAGQVDACTHAPCTTSRLCTFRDGCGACVWGHVCAKYHV